MELRIPFATMLKVALFLLLVFCVIKLYAVILMVVVAGLIAVLLDPLQDWMQRHGVKKGIALGLLTILVFGIVAGVIALIVPQTASQLSSLKKEMPQLTQRMAKSYPRLAPYVRSLTASMQQPSQPQQIRAWLSRALLAGTWAISGITAIILGLVLALYFVADGRRIVAWLISFAAPPERRKLAQTVDEVHPVVFAYMRGQIITSTLAFVVGAAVLVPLHVPAALTLALIAFIGDFVPVVGFIAASVPAVLLALTVSPTAAVIVAAVYIAYRFIEDYLVAPKVYGRSMKVSNLTVLLAIVIGGVLMGPIGAVLALPVVAAWAPIERIWFHDRLPEDTIEKHDALESEDHEEAEEATSEVLGE